MSMTERVGGTITKVSGDIYSGMTFVVERNEGWGKRTKISIKLNDIAARQLTTGRENLVGKDIQIIM